MSIINKVAGWLANISTYDATTGAITDLSVSGNVTGSALKAGPSGIVVSGNNITSASSPILIDPLDDGTPAGNVIIKGSMEVTGNLTYNDISTAVTSNLVWVAADDANTALTASGGGLAVGPNAAPYATWLYNSVSNAWVSNINASVAGNVTAAAFYGDGGHLSNISANAIAGGTYGNANLANIGANAVSTTGNISAAYFIGNGSALTGLPAGYGNANLANIGANAVSTTGNISGNMIIGNGALLTGLPVSSNYGNANLANIGSNAVGTTGNVTAAYHIGDGSLLTGTPTSVAYLNVSADSSVSAAIAAASTPDVRGKLFVITNTGNSTITLTGTFTGYTAFPLIASASSIAIPLGGVAEISTITAGSTYQIITLSNYASTNNNVFKIYPNAGNGPASDSIITFQNVEFDPLGYWNTGTNKYQPQVAGYYQITVQIATTQSSQNITAAIYKNGTQVNYGVSAQGSGGWQTAIVTSTIYLNGTTDYLQFGGRTNGYSYATPGSATFVTGGLISAGTTIAGSNVTFKALPPASGPALALTTSAAKIILPTVVINPSGFYNASNGRFTPTIAGYYRLVGRVAPLGVTTLTASIYVNGASVATGTSNTAFGHSVSAECSTVVYMNGTTDYAELWAFVGTATTVYPNSNITEFSGELIGGMNVAPQVAPSNAVLRAVGTSSTQSIGSTQTKVTVLASSIDPNSWWSNANSRFTPTIAGYYRVTGRIGTFNNGWASVQIYKNGVAYAMNILSTQPQNNISYEVNTLVYLNGSTDYLELWAAGTMSGGGNITIGGTTLFGPNAPEFCAELIGGQSVAAPAVLAATNAVGRVTHSGGLSIAASTGVKLTLSVGAGAFDPNGWWDGTNNRWKPTLAGYYNVTAQIGLQAAPATGYTQLAVLKNGVTVGSNVVDNAQAGGLPFVNVHDVVYMNGTTDYLECSIWQSSGTTLTTYSNTSYNYFALSLVGGTGATVLPPPATVVSYTSTVTTPLADNTTFSSNAAAPTTVLTYNLPAAGTWELHSQISYGISSATGQINIALFDSAGVMVPNTQSMGSWTTNTGWRGTDDRQYMVTTSAAATYTIRVWSTVVNSYLMHNSTYGYTNGYCKQIGAVGLTSDVGLTPNWTSAGPITFGANFTVPTKPSGVVRDNMSYRQIGPKTWEVTMVWGVSGASGGAPGSGDYIFTLPNGLAFDLTLPFQATYSGSVGVSSPAVVSYILPGSNGTANDGTTYGSVYAVPLTATQFRVATMQGTSSAKFWNNVWYTLTSNVQLTLNFKFQST